MRYEFIESHRDEFQTKLMCEVLDVSRTTYYAWRNRGPSQREQDDKVLLKEIREIHENSRQTYGSPRVYRAMQARGHSVGRRRVARLMRENGIRAVQKRRTKRTTNSNHNFAVAPNLLDRNFEADKPNQVWLTDITYVRTSQGWLYLAAVLDMYSRKIVGWAMDRTMSRQLCINALEMAITNRKPAQGLVHHSDRGSQYASDDYQQLLEDQGFICSMSRKADCWDNAPMESFFGTLKTESLNRYTFESRNEARAEIFDFIEIFYNRKRTHSALDFVSPTGFEEAQAVQVA